MATTAIILLNELIRLKGVTTDKELYENVKKVLEAFGEDISRSEFNKLLMTLELRGYIKVEGVRRGSRIVHLARPLMQKQ